MPVYLHCHLINRIPTLRTTAGSIRVASKILETTKENPTHHFFTKEFKKRIRKIVCRYGFVECAKILMFLDYVCDEELTRNDLAYVFELLCEILIKNDDGSDYFYEIRHSLREMQILINPIYLDLEN